MPAVVLPGVAFTYVYGKSVYFFTIVLAAVPPYLWLLYREPRFRPATNRILLAAMLFLAVSGMATITSADAQLSFWGYPQRMTGLWPTIHYLVFMFMASSVFRGEKDWVRVIGIAAGVASSVALAALLEAFQGRIGSEAIDDRVSGLLGNPAFLGDYLSITVLLSIWLMGRVKSLWVVAVLAAAVLAQVFAVVFTETRGAMVGLVVGTLVYAAVRSVHLSRIRGTSVVLGGGLLLSLAVAAWGVVAHGWGAELPGVRRFYDMSWQSPNVEARLINWKIAIAGLWERPILGWGPETYSYVFERHYDPRIEVLEFEEKNFDRVHSKPLEVASDTGLVGFLAYLACIGLVFSHIFYMRRRGGIDDHTFGISLGIGSTYLVSGFFLFDHPSSLLMLGLALGWWNSWRFKEGDVPRQFQRRNGMVSRMGLHVGFALSAGVVFGLWYQFVLLPTLSSVNLKNAVFLSRVDFGDGVELFEGALRNRQQYRDLAPEVYAEAVLSHARRVDELSPEVVREVDRAYEQLATIAGVSPARGTRYLLMARLQVEGARADAERLGRALTDVKSALVATPRWIPLLRMMAQICAGLGDHARAVRVLSDIAEASSDDSRAWRELAVAQFNAGLTDDGVRSLRKSVAVERRRQNDNQE
jgi:O-antigen ligase